LVIHWLKAIGKKLQQLGVFLMKIDI